MCLQQLELVHKKVMSFRRIEQSAIGGGNHEA